MRTSGGLLGALLLLAGCGGGGAVVQAEDAGTAPTGAWLSTSIREDGPAKALVAGHRISLRFHEDGRLSASGDCNTSSGTLRLADGRMWVDGLGTTAMGCPGDGRHERDTWLAEFLGAAPAYTFDGDHLSLSTATTAVALAPREVADPDLPLEGTRWAVTTLTTGPPPGAPADPDAAVSAGAPPGAGGELVFAAGRVRGTVDCVRFSGDAVPSGAVIAFGPLEDDRSRCAKGAGRVADPVLAVLAGEVRFEIEARGLRLTHASGRGLDLRGHGAEPVIRTAGRTWAARTWRMAR